MKLKVTCSLIVFTACLSAQERGAALRLVPSEPLTEPRPPKAEKEPQGMVRPAILNLKPAGDPIYLEGELAPDPDRDQWRTYQRPKVDRISKNGEGFGLQGYDVVSYLENRAGKGRGEFAVEFGGAVWLFATSEHRDLFEKDPARFLPQYGGFCAYSVGRGYPATADPRAFAIENGKLYLFFDKAVQAVWEQDRRRLIAAADRYWPQIHR